jgi:hypothetical protein
VNVLGNAVATLAIARMGGALDVATFEDELRRPRADVSDDPPDIDAHPRESVLESVSVNRRFL